MMRSCPVNGPDGPDRLTDQARRCAVLAIERRFDAGGGAAFSTMCQLEAKTISSDQGSGCGQGKIGPSQFMVMDPAESRSGAGHPHHETTFGMPAHMGQKQA